MNSATVAGIARRRLQNQGLLSRTFDKPVDAVRWLGAVQAQDYHGAKWAVAQRTGGIDNATLDSAFDRGEILRTHVMRPTWHFVVPEDIRWLLRLTAPRVNAAMASYNRKLELDDSVFRQTDAILTAVLRGGSHLTRKEIAAAFHRSGIAATGQRLAHILMHAELDALICSGPLRGKQFTYALLDERVPPADPVSGDESLAELTRRYFNSHGPATLQDYAWWSGLTMAEVRAGVEMTKPQLVKEVVNGVTYWLFPAAAPARSKRPFLHLLPNYDEHIVAYRDHRASFDARLLDPRGVRPEALGAHIVTLNGFVVGGWRRILRRDRIDLETDMLMDFGLAESKALERCAEEYGRFMGLPVAIDRG